MMIRGISPEVDKNITGRVTRQTRFIGLIWAILALSVAILVFFSHNVKPKHLTKEEKEVSAFFEQGVVKVVSPTREWRGTGFLIAPNRVMTNTHVVKNLKEVDVFFLKQNQPIRGKVIVSFYEEWLKRVQNKDSLSWEEDVAIIEISAQQKSLVIPLGESRNLRDGEEMLLLGYHGGLDESISHLQWEIRETDGDFVTDGEEQLQSPLSLPQNGNYRGEITFPLPPSRLQNRNEYNLSVRILSLEGLPPKVFKLKCLDLPDISLIPTRWTQEGRKVDDSTPDNPSWNVAIDTERKKDFTIRVKIPEPDAEEWYDGVKIHQVGFELGPQRLSAEVPQEPMAPNFDYSANLIVQINHNYQGKMIFDLVDWRADPPIVSKEFQLSLTAIKKSEYPDPFHLGMDFGTANSTIALILPDENKEIDTAFGEVLSIPVERYSEDFDARIMPSVVSFGDNLTHQAIGRDVPDVSSLSVSERKFIIKSVKRNLIEDRGCFINEEDIKEKAATFIMTELLRRAVEYLEEQGYAYSFPKICLSMPTMADQIEVDRLVSCCENALRELGIQEPQIQTVDESYAALFYFFKYQMPNPDFSDGDKILGRVDELMSVDELEPENPQRNIYDMKLNKMRKSGKPQSGQVIAVLSPGIKSTYSPEWNIPPEVAVYKNRATENKPVEPQNLNQRGPTMKFRRSFFEFIKQRFSSKKGIRKMKRCIHPEHPAHAKKRKPLEIPDDAKYCIYCGLPQEDVLGAIEQVTQSLSELRKELNKMPVPQQDPDLMERITSQGKEISNLKNGIDIMAKRLLKEEQNTIAKLCQVLLDITTKDPEMRKFGENIQSLTSNLLKNVSEILFDECLNEGRQLVRISELVSEINTLLEGKADSFVEKINGIADEAKITGEDYKPMSLGIPPFEQYISQNARNLIENSPIDMYLDAVQEKYTKSLREFAKKVKQNIDKWAIIIVSRKDRELEEFIKNDIPTLFKIIEAEKDGMESGAKSEIEAKQEELFKLSGLSKIDLAS